MKIENQGNKCVCGDMEFWHSKVPPYACLHREDDPVNAGSIDECDCSGYIEEVKH